MRIRSKRFAPSDLHQIQSLSNEIPKSAEPSNPPPSSSYQNTVICSEILAQNMEQEQLESEDGEEKHGDTDISIFKNARILVQDINGKVLHPSSSPDIDTDGRWNEGDKIVPFKKRKGTTSERCAIDDTLSKAGMQSKTNEKYSLINVDDNDNHIDDGNIHSANKSKKKRGNVIMEGSRCSRVNGRGWRCCKPTLVGYALCEHHLGKGRLRSMTSIRKRSMSRAKTKNKSSLTGTTTPPVSPIMCALELESKGLGDIDEKKPALVVTKKRSKIGRVKARSISSLLGQTDCEVRK